MTHSKSDRTLLKTILKNSLFLFFYFLSIFRQVFAQILLTFRYGRDDEEVMGLKLSNESVLCVEQICPLLPGSAPRPLNKCQVKKFFFSNVANTVCSFFSWTNKIGSAYAATWTTGAYRQFEVTSRRASVSATSTSQRVQRSSYRHKL